MGIKSDMGFYKKLKMQVDASDASAILLVAQLCEAKGDLHQALYWYRQTTKVKEIAALEAKIAYGGDEDDIFS